MEKILSFIRMNYIGFLFSLAVFGLYLYETYEGNRICGCESTENYRPSTTRTYIGSHFYHK